MAEMRTSTEFIKGLWNDNPVLRLLLGLCPALAVTTSVVNGIGMGLATTFVLVCSNIVVSLIRGFIPAKMRIPCFIVVIATFVTIVDLVLQGYFFELSKSLGVFVPLIVVNCVILQRAEAFASKQSLWFSLVDAAGMGLGFILALAATGAVREILGNGTLLGYVVPVLSENPAIIMILPPGAFITLGLLVAGMNWIMLRREHIERERAQAGRTAQRRMA